MIKGLGIIRQYPMSPELTTGIGLGISVASVAGLVVGMNTIARSSTSPVLLGSALLAVSIAGVLMGYPMLINGIERAVGIQREG